MAGPSAGRPPVAVAATRRRSPYSATVRLLLVEDDVVIARELLLRWGSRSMAGASANDLLAAEEALAGKAGESPTT